LRIGGTENFKKIFVGDEVESGQTHPLSLQILGQTFGALVQFVQNVLQFVETVCGVATHATLQSVRILVHIIHDFLVICVCFVELLRLFIQGDTDVFRAENGLQIDPLVLDAHPKLNHLENAIQVIFPLFDLLFHRTSIFTCTNVAEDKDRVFELGANFIRTFDCVASLLVLSDLKTGLFPLEVNLLDQLFVFGFTFSFFANFSDFFGMILEFKFEHFAQSDVSELEFALSPIFASLLHNSDPMAFDDSRMIQLLNERNRGLESTDSCLQLGVGGNFFRVCQLVAKFLNELLEFSGF